MVLLYHYTDKPGIDDIYKRNVIKASPDGPHGAGVYFTELAPTTSKNKIALNIWGTSDESKTKFSFKLRTEEYPDIKDVSSGDINLWFHVGDIKINDDHNITLYHYTDLRGKEGIEATGVIKKGRPWLEDGVLHPAVVHFTQIAPDQFEPVGRRGMRMRKVFGAGDSHSKEIFKKTQYWFRVRVSDLPGVRRERAPRHGGWVYEGDVPIHRRPTKPTTKTTTPTPTQTPTQTPTPKPAPKTKTTTTKPTTKPKPKPTTKPTTKPKPKPTTKPTQKPLK